MDSHVKLDEKLWSALPLELLETTLAYLPFSSFYRFRCVCKRWNSLLSCEGFLKHCKSLPLRTEPCILYRKTDSQVFSDMDPHACMLLHHDSTRGACSKIDLQFLKEHLDTSNGGIRHKVYAADGGLLLIASNQRDQHERFSVCNPLLKRWRQLPILPAAPYAHCQIRRLVFDKLTKAYKVIVVTRRDIPEMGCVGRTFVYDSISRCWNETGNIPRQPWEVMDQTVVCGNVMYVMVYGTGSYLDETIMMAYHIGSGVWSEVRIQPPSLSIWTRQLFMTRKILVESRGRVFLVIAAGYNYPFSIALWELKMGSTSAEWKELAASIPDQLINIIFSDFDLDDYEMTDRWWWWAMGFGDYILLKWHDVTKTKKPRTVVYDLLQGSWQRGANITWPVGLYDYQLDHFSVGSLSLGMEA
ncbi:hypothetical protein O6H91_03G106900 [Diphasiastrum complanatum]|uniref:Uncharacterized protein n=1 Tax=Diphasiastrum complanatum TaxID=34168 RepID=A0ACC2EA79_DIPCM|nr:hypothetical protein O6H91_03G106900 [Diphasiastrum complanatum]